MGVGVFRARVGKGRDPGREVGLSVFLSVPIHPRVSGALDLCCEGSDLDTLLEDSPVLLFVFTGSVHSLDCILGRQK